MLLKHHLTKLCFTFQTLYLEWARPLAFYKKQPLWLIKRYFGDKIGLYFAWLGFYTQMLIPAAICGLVVFIYGLVTLNSEDNYPVKDICEENITLCPNCDSDCDFEPLETSCPLAKLTYVVDNNLTVFFAIFMSFWGKDLWLRNICTFNI